jgi:hypothetical protein
MMTQSCVLDPRTLGAVDGLPSWVLQHFELRGLMLAQPGQRTVLTEGRGVPGELEWLNARGFGCRPQDLVFAPPHEHPEVNGLPLNPGDVVQAFTNASPFSHGLAKAHGCRLLGVLRDEAVRLNRKSTLQGWREELPWIPNGEVVRTPEEVHAAIIRLLASSETGEVGFKPDFSASGVGLRRFRDIPESADLESTHLPGVVQEWVPQNASVSIQFEFDALSCGRRICLTGQHVDANGSFSGGFWPVQMYIQLSSAVFQKICDIWRALAHKLSAEHYVGYGSADIMVDMRTNRVWLAELNLRDTAQKFAFYALLKRLGRIVPFDMRGGSIPEGMAFTDLVRAFEGGNLTLPPINHGITHLPGAVPFCFIPEGVIEEEGGVRYGFCYHAVYGGTTEECRRLSRRVDAVRKELLETKGGRA